MHMFQRKSGFPMELKQKLLLFQDFSDSSIVQMICFFIIVHEDFLVYISVVLKFLLMLTYMSWAHTYVYDKKIYWQFTYQLISLNFYWKTHVNRAKMPLF